MWPNLVFFPSSAQNMFYCSILLLRVFFGLNGNGGLVAPAKGCRGPNLVCSYQRAMMIVKDKTVPHNTYE